MNIPLSSPDVGKREIEYVSEVIRSKQLSLGPWLTRFEERFAEYAGMRYAVAASSGTAALHMCVRATGIGPGDEVITTPFSFVASTNCMLYEGATPVLLDIDRETYNLDPANIRAFLEQCCSRNKDGRVLNLKSGQTVKAILPVHVFGLPCEMDAIEQIASEYGLIVLEDACEAIGAIYRGRRAGTFGDAAVFAFYPNKQITSAEGGMVVTNDASIAARCRSLRNQGRDEDGRWLTHVQLGFNYRLSDVHCALGLAQLERIEELLAARESVATEYSRTLDGINAIRLPGEVKHAERSWFVYVIEAAGAPGSATRDRIRNRLQQWGIATQAYFPAIHRQPYFAQYRSEIPMPLPNAESASDNCLAIPFSGQLTKQEIGIVCKELVEVIAAESRTSFESSSITIPA
ncbi:MAG: DegT/DnrJ/EryC1/StrS family aminotransferase [Candidatus Acidiferrales bacterium]